MLILSEGFSQSLMDREAIEKLMQKEYVTWVAHITLDQKAKNRAKGQADAFKCLPLTYFCQLNLASQNHKASQNDIISWETSVLKLSFNGHFRFKSLTTHK